MFLISLSEPQSFCILPFPSHSLPCFAFPSNSTYFPEYQFAVTESTRADYISILRFLKKYLLLFHF